MDKSYLFSALNPLISTTLFVTFFFLWRRQKNGAHIFNWALAYACAAIGSSVDFARVFVDNSAWLSFLANGFFMGVLYFAARGSNLRHSGRTQDRILIPFYALSVLAGIVFYLIHPSVLGRGIAASAIAAVMFSLAARTIWRARDIDRIDHLIAWSFVASAFMLLARPAVSYLYEGAIHTEADVATSFWTISFRVFAMLSWFAMAILFLLRITTDLMQELAAQLLTDPLTGIYNRRGFFTAAEDVVRKASPAMPAALLICDIDHFKEVNDSFGHGAGDNVIQGLAILLRQAMEESGCIVGRLGGEEFVALLPATNLAGGQAFAEELRTAFAACRHGGVPPTHAVTVSIGVAEPFGGESIDSLIERADGALYRAKREGRNRAEVANGEAMPFSDTVCSVQGAEIRRQSRPAACT